MAVPEESEKHDAKRHDRVAVDEESNIEQQSVIPIIDNEPKKADRLHGFKLMALLFALMVGTFMVILDWPIISMFLFPLKEQATGSTRIMPNLCLQRR